MSTRPMESGDHPRDADPLSDSLRWVLAFGLEPERSQVDWLAHELDPAAEDATDAICRIDADPVADLERLRLLKSGFKSIRRSGESSSDRRLAARYYAASIAAGLARHRLWISEQRPDRVLEAVRDLETDEAMPAAIRRLAREAIEIAESTVIERDDPCG